MDLCHLPWLVFEDSLFLSSIFYWCQTFQHVLVVWCTFSNSSWSLYYLSPSTHGHTKKQEHNQTNKIILLVDAVISSWQAVHRSDYDRISAQLKSQLFSTPVLQTLPFLRHNHPDLLPTQCLRSLSPPLWAERSPECVWVPVGSLKFNEQRKLPEEWKIPLSQGHSYQQKPDGASP